MLPLMLVVIALTLFVRPLRELAGTMLSLTPMAVLMLGGLYLVGLVPTFTGVITDSWCALIVGLFLVSVPLTRKVLQALAQLVGPRTAALLHLPAKA